MNQLIERASLTLLVRAASVVAVLLLNSQPTSAQSLSPASQLSGEVSRAEARSSDEATLFGRIDEGKRVANPSPLAGEVSSSKHFDYLQIQWGRLAMQTDRGFYPWVIYNNYPAPQFEPLGVSLLNSTTSAIGRQLAPQGHISFPNRSSLELYRQLVTSPEDFEKAQKAIIRIPPISPFWPVWRGDKPLSTTSSIDARVWATGEGHVAFMPRSTRDSSAELNRAVAGAMVASPPALSLPASSMVEGSLMIAGGPPDVPQVRLQEQPGALPPAKNRHRAVWAKSFFVDLSLQAVSRPSIGRLQTAIESGLLGKISSATIGNQILQAISPGVQARNSGDPDQRTVLPDFVYLEIVAWPDGTVLVAVPALQYSEERGHASNSIGWDYALSSYADPAATFAGTDGAYFYGVIYIPRKLLTARR